MKVIIIGGVAGGASCAARLRRLDEEAYITIYERTNYISYANCGLPYYIGDEIKDSSSLTLNTVNGFTKRFNVAVFVNHEVISIDSIKKEILVKNLITNEVLIDKYDKLVLSLGATPNIPPFFQKSFNIFTLRTVEDAIKIKEYLKNNQVKTACVIGGGYIGIEMVENLTKLGISVSLIESRKQILNNLDEDMISFVHNALIDHGVYLYLNTTVGNLEVSNNKVNVNLSNNESIISDIVICCIGSMPESFLAKKASLDLGVANSIKVNEFMETSVKDIYAVGDVVEKNNIVSNQPCLISLAGPANKQGRIAADNICGIKNAYQGSLGSSIIKVFDLAVASTGINELICKQLNLNYEKVILSPMASANYYPGSKVLTLKLIYNKDNLNILGAQIVGYDGVDKRLDVIATAIFAKLAATSLKDLDLCYAPCFSTAKDPVNMAGFIIDNIENNLVKQFYYEDLEQLRMSDVILLDTRTKNEYERGHADGFINIPLDDLRLRINELDCKKKVYVMCQSGLRSYLATRILSQNNFDAYNFAGGYRLYSSISKSKSLVKESYECGMDK